MAVTQPSGMVKRRPFRHFKTTLERKLPVPNGHKPYRCPAGQHLVNGICKSKFPKEAARRLFLGRLFNLLRWSYVATRWHVARASNATMRIIIKKSKKFGADSLAASATSKYAGYAGRMTQPMRCALFRPHLLRAA